MLKQKARIANVKSLTESDERIIYYEWYKS